MASVSVEVENCLHGESNSGCLVNQMSISAASNLFSVPRKTLDDRIKGHIRHGSKPGVIFLRNDRPDLTTLHEWLRRPIKDFSPMQQQRL